MRLTKILSFLSKATKQGRMVASVIQTGLMPVVSHWEEQSAGVCRQPIKPSADNKGNSAPYGLSRESHFPRLHTDERVWRLSEFE